MTAKMLLRQIWAMDPDREGIPETHLTCDEEGRPRVRARLALELCIELGWVARHHPLIDITDTGVSEIKKSDPN